MPRGGLLLDCGAGGDNVAAAPLRFRRGGRRDRVRVVALEGSNLSPGRSTLLGASPCMPVGSPRCSHSHVLEFFLKGGSWCSRWPLVTTWGQQEGVHDPSISCGWVSPPVVSVSIGSCWWSVHLCTVFPAWSPFIGDVRAALPLVALPVWAFPFAGLSAQSAPRCSLGASKKSSLACVTLMCWSRWG